VRWEVPLSDLVITADDLDAVVETYRSGWLSTGPRTQDLEEAFAEYVGARFAIAVANGTAALHLICLAAGLGPGDEVIVPSLTFVATVNAVAYTGATPVFADVAGLTKPWLAARAAEAAITPRTRAIMNMPYGGYPGETVALRDLGRQEGVVLLEDAAHAAGSRHGGVHLGTFGVAGAFSFFSNKNLAIGEGGMVVTDDGSIADRVRLLRSHGMTTLSWDRHRGHASGYDVVSRGFNYRLDEPRAALALSRLKRLDEDNRRRARLDSRYREELTSIDGATAALDPPVDATLAHHLFTIVLDETVDRDAFRAGLSQRGIQTSVHYPAVHRFSVYRREEGQPLPVTDQYAARTVTLPLFPHMSDGQQAAVIEAVSATLNRATVRRSSSS
jgi:dTDP-4-amino-4,6-dideoxygalactose transaminase